MKSFRQFTGVSIILIIAAGFVIITSASKIIPKSDPVTIGLLIPDSKSTAAIQGAELAISKANREGGLNGRPFKLVVRSLEGPWGTGSKQAVNLVFDEKVWAILGSQDGRNAHLIEQVSAKTRVPYISSWSGDPTLAEAFVPWFFNCVPDDRQQAAALFNEIYSGKEYLRPLIISDDSYDSKSLEKYFSEEVRGAGKNTPKKILCNPVLSDFNRLPDSINIVHPDCLVLLSGPAAMVKVIRTLKGKEISLPIFTSLAGFDENAISEKELAEFRNVTVISPIRYDDPDYLAFCKEYSIVSSRYPGPVASYSYDAMMMLIRAIKESGAPDYQEIKQSLLNMEYNGVTGKIHFDKMGSRTGTCYPAKIKNGNLVTIDHRVP